jgi:hypothetical protein
MVPPPPQIHRSPPPQVRRPPQPAQVDERELGAPPQVGQPPQSGPPPPTPEPKPPQNRRPPQPRAPQAKLDLGTTGSRQPRQNPPVLPAPRSGDRQATIDEPPPPIVGPFDRGK